MSNKTNFDCTLRDCWIGLEDGKNKISSMQFDLDSVNVPVIS